MSRTVSYISLCDDRASHRDVRTDQAAKKCAESCVNHGGAGLPVHDAPPEPRTSTPCIATQGLCSFGATADALLAVPKSGFATACSRQRLLLRRRWRRTRCWRCHIRLCRCMQSPTSTTAAQVAADALLAVAGQLTAAQSALSERLVGRGDVPEHHSPDAVFQVHHYGWQTSVYSIQLTQHSPLGGIATTLA